MRNLVQELWWTVVQLRLFTMDDLGPNVISDRKTPVCEGGSGFLHDPDTGLDDPSTGRRQRI